MHTLFNRSLAAAAVTLAFAGAALASQASKPASSPSQTKPATAAHNTASKAKAGASHSAMGTIEKYDSNMLTLKTPSGEEQFTLASSARIRNGSKAIKAEDLSSLTGQRAKVRYTESNGQRTAESVMVSGAARSKPTKG
jgi:hypothetical protein